MMMSVCRSQNLAHTEDLVGSTDVLTWTLIATDSTVARVTTGTVLFMVTLIIDLYQIQIVILKFICAFIIIM